MSNSSARLMPEFEGNPFIESLPEPMSQKEAHSNLTAEPVFDAAERSLPWRYRIECTRRLERCFKPLPRHFELEREVSFLLRRGYIGRSPWTPGYIQQLRALNKAVTQPRLLHSCAAANSGARGFSLLGCSGVGKTTSVTRILSLFPQVVEHREPALLKQLVWLRVEAPSNGSVKQLCINYFMAVDHVLGTRYLQDYGADRKSAEIMMVHMAQIAAIHGLGLLVLDEIQHVLAAKGRSYDQLMNFLVTFENVIGAPVIKIGTPAAEPLLTDDFRQARRACGMGPSEWGPMDLDADWNHLIEWLWRFQWTKEPSPLTQEIVVALYEESQGIMDILLKLMMRSQETAIVRGFLSNQPESLSVDLIKEVAAKHLGFVKPMLSALRDDNAAKLALFRDLRARKTPAASQSSKSSSASQAAQMLEALVRVGLSEAQRAALEAVINPQSAAKQNSPTSVDSGAPEIVKKSVQNHLLSTVLDRAAEGLSGYEKLKRAGYVGSAA